MSYEQVGSKYMVESQEFFAEYANELSVNPAPTVLS
jgi:hypothetical protein